MISIDWKKTGLRIAVLIAIAVFLYLMFFTLTPFTLGIILVIVIDKPVSLLEKKIPRLPRGVTSLLMIAVVVIIIIMLATVVISYVVEELISLSQYLPQYREQIIHLIDEAIIRQSDFFEHAPQIVIDIAEQNINNLYQWGNDILSQIPEGLLDITFRVPILIIMIIFTVLSAFFLSKDKYLIIDYIMAKLQLEDQAQAEMIKDILTYVRVQLSIMTITTIITALLFFRLDFYYAMLLALLCGILDIIPVVGPGGILWPLIIYYIFFDPPRAIMVFLAYIMCISVRYVFESRVLGGNIGVHPVILLLGLYLGFTLLGIKGIILAPISIIVYKAVLNTGKI